MNRLIDARAPDSERSSSSNSYSRRRKLITAGVEGSECMEFGRCQRREKKVIERARQLWLNAKIRDECIRTNSGLAITRAGFLDP